MDCKIRPFSTEIPVFRLLFRQVQVLKALCDQLTKHDKKFKKGKPMKLPVEDGVF